MAVGAVLLVLGAVGVPAGLAVDGGPAEPAEPAAPAASPSLPGWRQPPEQAGTNIATLPAEDIGFEGGEISGHVTMTVTDVECGIPELAHREGLGWEWTPRNGQFCLVHLSLRCEPPPGSEDGGSCRFSLGLQTAITSSGEEARVFNENNGRPLHFLNDVEGVSRGMAQLEAPPSGDPAEADVVIPYDITDGETITGMILYTDPFIRAVEVTVAQ